MSENTRTLDLSTVEIHLTYSSGSKDLLRDFYLPCLSQASKYDRAAGFFRSSVFNLVGVVLSEFALRGGKMRLVCSPALEPADIEALSVNDSSGLDNSLSRDLESVLLQPEYRPVTEFLATLVAYNALDIKLAYRPSKSGIFHTKLGLIEDELSNTVSFTGSENETPSGWDSMANYEGFDAFTTFSGSNRETARVAGHREEFENLWNNKLPNLIVAPFPEVPRSILTRHANADGIAAAIEKARTHLQHVGLTATTSRRIPQRHQLEVAENWRASRRGLIDHVTGGGKTFSAICIIRDWVSNPGHPALILTPGSLLADQWQRELKTEIAGLDPRFLRVGGDSPTANWRQLVDSFTNPGNRRGANVTISTMQSACRSDFLSSVNQGEHLLLVADEVHKIGSVEHRKLLKIDAGGRLGLSATPERFMDPAGTAAIFEYFGDILDPPFGIQEAQAAGRLVKYDYHITLAALTESEELEHARISLEIARLRARLDAGDASVSSDSLHMMLIKRARILKSAENKVPTVADIMEREFKPNRGQRWLVYCDDTAQLEAVNLALDEKGIGSQRYTSDMVSAKRETLKYFEKFGGVLLSIHCLDEGIDIPSVTHAVLVASSVNPREQLQRRGRVLRKTVGKQSADIHDILIGLGGEFDVQPFRSEVERAERFAGDARNRAILGFQLDGYKARSSDDEPVAFEPLETMEEGREW